MDPWDRLGDELNRMIRKIRDLENEVAEVRRQAQNAASDCERLEQRVRDLEYSR